MNKNVDKENIFVNILIKSYFEKEILNLLYYIHYKFPKIFDNEKLKYSIKKYLTNKNIKFCALSKEKKIKFIVGVKKKIFIRKFRNRNIGGMMDKTGNSLMTFNPKKCNSRVWNNGTIYKLEGKNKFVYGKQCQFKKMKGSCYCKNHARNNPHGDFNKTPSKELILHYKKYNNICI